MINLELKNIDELRKVFDPRLVNRALNTAVARGSRKVKTKISRDVRGIYNIKARDIAKAATLRRTRSYGSDVEYLLQYKGSRIGLMHFGAKEVRISGSGATTLRQVKGAIRTTTARRVSKNHRAQKGVSVLVRKDKGRRIVGKIQGQAPFIATGKHGNVQVFARKGQSRRLPIRKATGISIAEMVENDKVIQGINKTVREEIPKEFTRAMKYFTGQV